MLAYLQIGFPKIGIFGILVFNLQIRLVKSIFFVLCLLIDTNIWQKFHSHTYCSSRDLRGVFTPPAPFPPILLSCVKRQFPLTVKLKHQRRYFLLPFNLIMHMFRAPVQAQQSLKIQKSYDDQQIRKIFGISLGSAITFY